MDSSDRESAVNTKEKFRELKVRVDGILESIQKTRLAADVSNASGNATESLKDPYVVDLRIQELKLTNRVLLDTIKQCEETMSTIMGKFREQQTAHYKELERLREIFVVREAEDAQFVQNLGMERVFYQTKLRQGAEVLKDVMNGCFDSSSERVMETIARLSAENQALRKMLHISNQYQRSPTEVKLT